MPGTTSRTFALDELTYFNSCEYLTITPCDAMDRNAEPSSEKELSPMTKEILQIFPNLPKEEKDVDPIDQPEASDSYPETYTTYGLLDVSS